MAIIRDFCKKAKDAGISALLGMLSEDNYPKQRRMQGEIFWTLREDATGKETRGHFKNVVTLDASLLIATFMKGTGTAVANTCVPDFGVYALAVGTGDVSWDPMNPPAATETQRSLYNELARKAISATNFIDASGNISGVRTNVVDFTTTFTSSEAVGALCEMGLIGGDCDTNMSIRNPILPPNGTYDPTVDVSGKDLLVNYKTFPVVNKPLGSSLTYTWRLSW